MKLRKARASDLLFLYRLRNLPSVRRWSFNNKLLKLGSHKQWFCKKLADPNVFMLIAEESGRKIAQIRFDFNPRTRTAEVGIAVKPFFRGKGKGSFILQTGCRYALSRYKVKKIKAHIKKKNSASLRLFTRAGFQNLGVRYFKGHPCVEMILWNS